MAVSVEIKDAAKASKNLASPTREALESVVLPDEKRMGFIALGVWIGALVLLCLPWSLSKATLPFAIGMPLWCLFSVLFGLLLGPNFALKTLRNDAKARVSAQNRGQIKTVLNKISPIIGVDEPAAFFDAGAAKSELRVYPQTLVIGAPLEKTVDANELAALAARGVAHEKLGHSRRLGLLHLMAQMPSPLIKFLVWPLWIYAALLERLWLPLATQNADRVALLVIRNLPLLLSAILKEKAANSAHMQSLGVTGTDITNWISQKGHIGMAGEEISTQYKLGRAIHEDPPFEIRVQGLQRFADSAPFKEAVEKLAQGARRN